MVNNNKIEIALHLKQKKQASCRLTTLLVLLQSFALIIRSPYAQGALWEAKPAGAELSRDGFPRTQQRADRGRALARRKAEFSPSCKTPQYGGETCVAAPLNTELFWFQAFNTCDNQKRLC